VNGGDSFARGLAIRLATHAANLLSDERSDWAQAITNEIRYVPSDSAALGWAIGCLFASYKERMRIMNTANSKMSRWISSLEMLVCFLPLSLLGLAVASMLLTGRMPIQVALPNLLTAAIGPIGLIVAFRMFVLQRFALSGPMITVLCIAATWTILAFASGLAIGGNGSIGEWWREFVLIALLPAVGSAHLIFIANRSSSRLTTS